MGVLRTYADRSFGLGLKIVTALKLLHQQDKAQLDFFLGNDEGGIITSKMLPPVGNTPGYYLGSTVTGQVVALIDQVDSIAMAAALIDGYSSLLRGIPPANIWADGISDLLLAQLNSLSFPAYNTLTVGGHSGGGLIAQLLADKWLRAHPGTTVRWHTFGQPRTSGESRAVLGASTPGVRWMWHADPVPLLPFRFTDAPFLTPIVGIPTMIQWSNTVHWEGGWQLVPGQVGHPEEVPTSAAVAVFTNVAAWLYEFANGLNTGHSIFEYEGYMINEASYYNTPTSSLRQLATTERPANVDRRAETQQERQVVQTIVNAEARQNAVPVAIPDPQVFEAVRFGRIWTVEFGGVQVAISPSKRGARGLAREMNLALRRLQRAPVVDPAAFGTQMQAYLAAASDPAGGFRPVMNTTFG
jgi:Lipase (class 3)